MKEELAADLRAFLQQVKDLPNPVEAIRDLLMRTHVRIEQPDLYANAILAFADRPVSDFWDRANMPLLQPLLTLYGGPAEQMLGDELWGKGWGVAGRYRWTPTSATIHDPEGAVELRIRKGSRAEQICNRQN